MEYVMVPVPEEIVDEVRAFLTWEVQAEVAEPDNPDAIIEVYEAADSTLRTVLMTVATAALDGERLPLRDVSATAGITVHGLIGLLADLNHRLRTAGGQIAAMMMRPDHRPQPDGVSDWEHRVIQMTDEIAARIVNA